MKLAALAFAALVVLSSFATPFGAALLLTAPAAGETRVDASQDDGPRKKGDAAKKDDAARKEAAKKREAEAKAAAKTLREALKADETIARRTALIEASEVVHPKVIAEMAKALSDDEVSVRHTAIERLGFMQHEDALASLNKYAKSSKRKIAKDVETRVALIKAIGRHRDEDSLKWFASGMLQEEEFAVRQARVYSIALQRTPAALDTLMSAMSKADPRRLRGRMRELQPALVYITGVDRGRDPAKWTQWWSENKKTFEIPETPPRMSESSTAAWRRFWGERQIYERRKKRGDRG